MFLYKVFLIFIVLGLGLSFQTKACKDLFETAGMPLSSANPFSIKPKKSYSKEEKEALSKEFLYHYDKKDKESMEALVTQNPFLKNIRIPLPDYVLIKFPKQMGWFDAEIGWTPLQMASYNRDLDLLKFFLKLGFPYKAKKKKGGISVEYNPLHIAIVRDFPEGAKSILSEAGLQKLGFHTGQRFIDEKDAKKRTPWTLAVFQDMKNKQTQFVHIIGRYEPSGYVESYIYDSPLDGYKVAGKYGSSIIIHLANVYLKAPNYKKYTDIKESSRRGKLKRTKKPSPFYFP